MSSPDELALLADDDLFELLLKEGCFMPDFSVRDNILLEDCGLPEPEPLDKDMDDFITSVLNPFQNKADMQQDEPPADGDTSMPEDQLQLLSFVNEFGFNGFSFSDSSAGSDFSVGSDFAGSDFADSNFAGNDFAGNEIAGNEIAGNEIAGSELAGNEVAATDPASNAQSSEFVQVDPNYSFHWDWSLLQSIASDLADMGEENMSTDVENWQRVEDTSTALVPTSGFPVPAPEHEVPEVEPAITIQASLPELVLTEEQKQLLMAEDFTCLPLPQVKDQLPKKVRHKVRNRQSTQNIYFRKKRNMDNLENKVAACLAQNQRLGNIWVLQKQIRSLLGESRKMPAFVNQPSKRPAVAKTCMMVVLSFGAFFSPNARMLEIIKAKLDLEENGYLMLWQQLISRWFPQGFLNGTPRAAYRRQKYLCCGRERGSCDSITLPQRGNPAPSCRCDFCRFLLLVRVILGTLLERGALMPSKPSK